MSQKQVTILLIIFLPFIGICSLFIFIKFLKNIITVNEQEKIKRLREKLSRIKANNVVPIEYLNYELEENNLRVPRFTLNSSA